MTDKQIEALKLADDLDAEFAHGRISNHTGRKAAQFIRSALAEPTAAENNGGKTGWPPGLLQDDCKDLSKWLSKHPDARRRVREALADHIGDANKMAEQQAQGCDYCNNPQYAGIECKNCGREQPAQQQEPVAVYVGETWCGSVVRLYEDLPLETPLYTSPQPGNPLTDEQIKLIMDGRGEEGDDDYVKPAFDPFGISEDDLMNFARAIEAAHGITGEKA